MVSLIMYAVLAAGIAFGAYKAWTGFTGGYITQGKEIQLKIDQPKVDAAELRAKEAEGQAERARSDTAACVSSTKTQSDAILAANKRADQAQAATRAIIDAAKRDSRVKQQRIDSLQSIASAPPKVDMTCPEELSKARAILQDTLRARRAAPAPVAPPAVTK